MNEVVFTEDGFEAEITYQYIKGRQQGAEEMALYLEDLAGSTLRLEEAEGLKFAAKQIRIKLQDYKIEARIYKEEFIDMLTEEEPD